MVRIRHCRMVAAGVMLCLGALFLAAPARGQANRGGLEKEKKRVLELLKDVLHGPAAERNVALVELGQLEKDQVREHKVFDFVLKFIRNDTQSPRLRRTAIDTAVKLATDVDTSLKEQALRELIRFLDSSRENLLVRRAVAARIHALVNRKSLGEHRRAIRILERIAGGTEPTFLRVAALGSVGRIGWFGSFAVISKALGNRDVAIQDAGFEALDAWLTVNPDGPPPKEKPYLATLFTELLTKRELPTRRKIWVIQISVKMKLNRAVSNIERLVSSMDPKIPEDELLLIEGVNALVSFARPSSMRVLIQTYVDFYVPGNIAQGAAIRKTVAGGLGEFITNSYERRDQISIGAATKQLVQILKSTQEMDDVLRTAAYAVGELAIDPRLPKREAIIALINLLDHTDDGVRANAKSSLEDLTLHMIRKGATPEDYKKRWEDWWKDNNKRFRK